MLAALGGGCMTPQTQPEQVQMPMQRVGRAKEATGLQGPWGQPIPTKSDGTMMQPGENAVPVRARGASPDGVTPAVGASSPGTSSGIRQTSATSKAGKAVAGQAPKDGLKSKMRTGQVPPPPPAGPPGAVAAVPGPALPGGLPMMGTARSSIRFVGQDGMQVAWFAPTGDGRLGFRDQLVSPGYYNFLQGGVYRLRLTNIPNRRLKPLYPTIEVAPQNPKTSTFLAHSSIPLTFTDDDFEQVNSGNFVVKVVYLPDPQFQDLAVAGPDEIVSTRLEPGVDPVQEAQRRGSVLLIVRLGNIDLESQGTPAMDAPNPYLRPQLPPGYMPPPTGAGPGPSGLPVKPRDPTPGGPPTGGPGILPPPG